MKTITQNEILKYATLELARRMYEEQLKIENGSFIARKLFDKYSKQYDELNDMRTDK